MKETLSRMSQYSMYALEEELRHGFFTIQGGHRVGVAGGGVCAKRPKNPFFSQSARYIFS